MPNPQQVDIWPRRVDWWRDIDLIVKSASKLVVIESYFGNHDHFWHALEERLKDKKQFDFVLLTLGEGSPALGNCLTITGASPGSVHHDQRRIQRLRELLQQSRYRQKKNLEFLYWNGFGPGSVVWWVANGKEAIGVGCWLRCPGNTDSTPWMVFQQGPLFQSLKGHCKNTVKFAQPSATPKPIRTKGSTKPFDDAFESRLNWLLSAIRQMAERKVAVVWPQIRYLEFLSTTGMLNTLQYLPREEPTSLSEDSGTFYFSLDQGAIRFSAPFKRAWLSMAKKLHLKEQELHDSLDNFILHELFHVGQNLTTERHADIRNAQSVLRVIDYHADANAVLAAIILHTELTRSAETGWQHLYPRIVLSVLRQMYVFDYASGREKMPPSRFVRQFTWHYQFHRISGFRGSDPFVKYQLSVEPAFSFRNLNAAGQGDGVAISWPNDEPAQIARDQPHLWMAVPNVYGIPAVHRFLSTKPGNYRALFEGVFECAPENSSRFLQELFNDFPDLIGQGENESSTKRSSADPISKLLDDFKREEWISILRDEGSYMIDVRPALENLLLHGNFAEFLNRSGLYFGWNKEQIDKKWEANERTFTELRTRYLKKYEALGASYPPR